MLRVVISLFTIALATSLLSATALAHARFASSSIAPGTNFADSPQTLSVTFTEELAAGSTGRVTNFRGVATFGSGTVDPNERKQMVFTIPSTLAPGYYMVWWHSISAEDGDVLEQWFWFGVQTDRAAPTKVWQYDPVADSPEGGD